MSDLTRLLTELPSEYFDDGRMAQGALALKALGGTFLGLGVVLAIGMVAAGKPDAAYGALGPLIAGGTNLGLGFLFGSRAKASKSVELTADARHMLLALVLERAPQRRFAVRGGAHVSSFSKPLVVVPKPVEDRLERLAGAYLALTSAAGTDSHHSVHAKVAAKEALSDGLNAAASAIRHPDGDDSATLDALIERMNEAATKLAPREEMPGTLDALLSDLREEERARQELRE